jgi:hypothetical protein
MFLCAPVAIPFRFEVRKRTARIALDGGRFTVSVRYCAHEPDGIIAAQVRQQSYWNEARNLAHIER